MLLYKRQSSITITTYFIGKAQIYTKETYVQKQEFVI